MTEPNPPGRNRRLNRRRPAKHRVKVVCRANAMDLGPNLALAVLDVSETGMRLMVKDLLRPGREVSVSLEGQSIRRPLLRVADVAWCVPAADGAYCLGVSFQKRLSYRDFVAFSREPVACV